MVRCAMQGQQRGAQEKRRERSGVMERSCAVARGKDISNLNMYQFYRLHSYKCKYNITLLPYERTYINGLPVLRRGS